MSAGLPRQQFLAAAFLAAVPGVAVLSAAAESTAAETPAPPEAYDGTVPFPFDRAAFGAILERPFAHRQIAAATTFASAASAMHFLQASLDAYADPNGFDAGPKALHVAAVLYGGPSPFIVLDDVMWSKYSLANHTGAAQDSATALASLALPAPGLNPHRAMLEGLARDHAASFFVCNNALSGLAALIAKALAPAGSLPTRAQTVAIHADFTTHLLPGATMVPAGVAALNAAQEARFTLIPART